MKNNVAMYILIGLLVVILGFGGYTVYSLNAKVSEQDKTINDLKTENKKQQSLIEELNKDKNKEDKKTNEELIKDLFLAKLKKIDDSKQEKLLDYRVDSVKVLSQDEIKDLPVDDKYKSNAVLALVTYSVKPKDTKTSEWASGNGEIENDWIVKKVSCEY